MELHSGNTFPSFSRIAVLLAFSVLLSWSTKSIAVDHTAKAKQLLRSAYPELSAMPIKFELIQYSWDNDRRFRIDLNLVKQTGCGCCGCPTAPLPPSWLFPTGPITFPIFKGWPFSPEPVDGKDAKTLLLERDGGPKPILSADFNFGYSWSESEPQLLVQFIELHGEAVDGKLSNFKKLTMKHREWSEERALQELANAGAKFGPNQKAKLLNSIPRAALEPLIGQFERIESAKFNVYDLESGYPDGATWEVIILTRPPKSRVTRYLLEFEAFDGKLMKLIRPYYLNEGSR